MKNYTQFASNFLKFIQARNLDLPVIIGNPTYEFETSITDGLLNCHIFEVTDDVKRLLVLTKTPKINDMIKLPFPVIFIDVNFKRKEMEKLGIDIDFDEIQGIIVREGKMYLRRGNVENDVNVGTNLRISISALEYRKAWIFETYAENKNFYDEYKSMEGEVEYVEEDGLNRKARRFIKMFVMNFLNFINDPCVQYVTVEHDKQRNEQRINDGKLPIPNRNVIKLTGVLKKYVSELSQDKTTWNHSIRWWVRGHFRILRDVDYWGAKAGTRIFIPPYIKGSGVLITKAYSVEKKKSDEVDNAER
jgi:hypothetical protein